MNFISKYLHFHRNTILLILLLECFSLKAQETKFTVVIDAGHGGHDPGAMGAISREKDLNLAITLDLGEIIEEKFKDVKVIYTRKTDKYITLPERADVANNNHADLFICIHTNSAPSPMAYGAETYTLGLAKTKANLDVAMRENSVILLEDDYKTKYKGFNPNSVESYIMFEFMQDKYIDKSVAFSSAIQKQFVSYSHRSDRGVRQAGFWVLHRSACPSVLIEVGFISNPSEEKFLTSETGQKEMATAIFNAFVEYKRMHDKKSGKQIYQVPKIEKTVKSEIVESIKSNISSKIQNVQIKNDTIDSTTKKIKPTLSVELKKTIKPVFKVQLFASKKTLKSNAPDFKGLKHADCFIENGLNKYTLGSDTDYLTIEKLRKEIHSKFPDAFIIGFIGNKKVTAKEALKWHNNE